ncbi:PREDICTED: sarcalumenin [Nicrophorus vespilloides]|uniref:Sarcalumenin n=1 Tax=Nicrophorus vespilloides TaxID=110193 RepID=A0ABM1N632_NICVS|nr:PREDICTED: sarcalumenin [Nicrophorus vespilloides]
MEISRKWKFSCLLLGLLFLATTLQSVQGEVEVEGPSESECRPYIEKALKELETAETEPEDPGAPTVGEIEDAPSAENAVDDSEHETSVGEDDTDKGEASETQQEEHDASLEQNDEAKKDDDSAQDDGESQEATDAISGEAKDSVEGESIEEEAKEESAEETHTEPEQAASSDEKTDDAASTEAVDEAAASTETVDQVDDGKESEEQLQADQPQEEEAHSAEQEDNQSKEDDTKEDADHKSEEVKEEDDKESKENDTKEDTQDETKEEESVETKAESAEVKDEDSHETKEADSKEAKDDNSKETKEDETKEAKDDDSKEIKEDDSKEAKTEGADSKEDDVKEAEPEGSHEDKAESKEDEGKVESKEDKDESKEDVKEGEDSDKSDVEIKDEDSKEVKLDVSKEEAEENVVEESATEESESKEEAPEEELILDIEIPENLRPRDQVDHLLKLDDSNSGAEAVLKKAADVTLKELKKLYENAIKPLETLYKYRDLSNRHFGDSEIFSKPLVLFMGPWSGGKSSIINYLLDNEYNGTSLRTGAEPSPAYFNLLMYGDKPEVLDGTQLAADFTFAGLQKFGQGLEERLRGLKLPSKLLEKINIVEIPGILEVRKQVSRVFPFNDACQWFIDRADIIFLVYDPSKLDVGPETEAILDQLKGREHQTRIILNKADQVKPEELMRVQGALIWNISPLMSSAQPPVMYTTSLWSRPYEAWAPVRLLQAQERAFLRDLRSAVDKRIENKISSARRFAVRVRNHAKMVDCYLTTYYNHKSVFGNRKQVSDQIIEHPQDYHIYEGLSTLTNISRYDLPDPDVYRDFFRLNALYDFQQLSATCTFFRGCPINRLDVAIAYDLPELVGKHKKLVDAAMSEIKTES